jgi:hypothetical protein
MRNIPLLACIAALSEGCDGSGNSSGGGSGTSSARTTQVAKGQIGAWPMESWYWNVMAQNSPDVNVSAVAFMDRQGKPFTFFTGSGWAIPRNAKHPHSRARG